MAKKRRRPIQEIMETSPDWLSDAYGHYSFFIDGEQVIFLGIDRDDDVDNINKVIEVWDDFINSNDCFMYADFAMMLLDNGLINKPIVITPTPALLTSTSKREDLVTFLNENIIPEIGELRVGNMLETENKIFIEIRKK